MSSSDDQDNSRKVVFVFLTLLLMFIIGAVLVFGVSKSRSKPVVEPVSAPVVNQTTPNMDAHTNAINNAANSQDADSEKAQIVIENGIVKFYFALGKSDLALGANEALADVVKGVLAGKKAQISGYHDASGNLATNQEIAKQRALAVRGALAALGLSEDKMILKKPEQSQGSGSAKEARRVEVELIE